MDNILEDYKKMLSDVLNINNYKSHYFAEAFDYGIRTENNYFINILYNYLDIIEDYIKFEEIYTYKIIERSIDEIFNKINETEIINKIISTAKDKFAHSYKLQTTINNIKISRDSLLNLIGIPAHSYHLLNIGCKPIIEDKELDFIFEKFKEENKFPTNSKIIAQQGWIEFSYSKNIIRVNCLQFAILNYIAHSKSSYSSNSIYQKYDLTEQLFEFLIEPLISNNLIIKIDDENIKFNYNFPTTMNKNKILDCTVNFEYFIQFKRDVYKVNNKHINNIIDANIMKYLKKLKKLKKTDIFKQINKITLYKIDELGDDRIQERLDFLTEKTLINKLNLEYYTYS